METAPQTGGGAAGGGQRQSLGRRVTQPLLEADGSLRVLALEPALEEELIAALNPEGGSRLLSAKSQGMPVLKRVVDSVKQLIGPAPSAVLPVLLCQSPARYYLRRWLEPLLPQVVVLAPTEVPPDVRLRSVGVVR